MPPRGRRRASRARCGLSPVERQRHPDERAEDQDGEAQMQREPILADVDAVGEAGAHHVPADRALQRAEREDAGEPGRQSARGMRPAARK